MVASASAGLSRRSFNALRCIGHSQAVLAGTRTSRPSFKNVTFCRNIYVSTTSTSSTTKVGKIILDTIRSTGPISFSTYMQLCLSHPTDGYYMNPENSVFGARGDFTTSPEISQVFGELIAVWMLSEWMKASQPSRIRIVEMGPGRGTLMDDVLRVFQRFPSCYAAVKSVHLVESSPAMRALQEKKLSSASPTPVFVFTWHEAIDDIPADEEDWYTMLIAHEFFDALPIHVIERTEQGWHELLIFSAPDPAAPSVLAGSFTDSIPTMLRPVRSPTPTALSNLLAASSPRFRNLPVGARVEVSPAAFKTARKIGELLVGGGKSKGCALIVDYGGEKAYGNSFRAFKEHKLVDVFHQPGECDLTANVDFAYLKEAVQDIVNVHGPLSQAEFLARMGLQVRLDALMRAAKSDERKEIIEKAARRLVDATGMGNEYQVLGITSPRLLDNSEEPWPFVKVDVGGS